MIQEVDLGGRTITLVGTAHISEESRKETLKVIEEEKPDLVAVELDESRLKSLKQETGWRDLDVAEAIRDGKGFMLLLNLVLSVYQRQLGLEEGMKPGEEMLAAIEKAEELDIETSLVDRDINETLERAMEQLTLWEKAKLFASLFMVGEEIDVEELKEGDMLDLVVRELESEFPSLGRVFLEERNSYMVEKLLEEDFDHAVVVVGAAHVQGMKKILEEEKKHEVQAPRDGFPWFKAVSYGMPVFIIGMLGYSFYKIGFSTGVEATAFWIGANGVLAMLGAVIARSSPLTWLVSFLAAPLTSLDPALGAGMVASYAEAKFNPPTVGELEDVTSITEYRQLWSNQVGVILLTFFFVTLGSAAATFISAGYIASIIGF